MNISTLRNLTDDEFINYVMNINSNNEMFAQIVDRFISIIDKKSNQIAFLEEKLPELSENLSTTILEFQELGNKI